MHCTISDICSVLSKIKYCFYIFIVFLHTVSFLYIHCVLTDYFFLVFVNNKLPKYIDISKKTMQNDETYPVNIYLEAVSK